MGTYDVVNVVAADVVFEVPVASVLVVWSSPGETVCLPPGETVQSSPGETDVLVVSVGVFGAPITEMQ